MATDTAPRFVIRTASGDKGPFSQAQIASFVAAGKLPPTAKILDTQLQAAVTAADAIAEPSAAEAPAEEPAGVNPNAETPQARALRAPSTARHGRKGNGRITANEQRRGGTRDGRDGRPGTGRIARKPKKNRTPLIVVAVLALAGAAAGGFYYLQTLKEDRFVDQHDRLLADALAHADAVAPSGVEPAFARYLIKLDHKDALAASKNQRGTYDGKKPAYDEAKYRDALKQAIAKQADGSDTALMSACAKELMQADAPSAADVAAAQKIAQKAVDLDHEKNAVSLDALAWALFRSGDLRRAGVIEEQAISLAPSTGIKTECEKGLRRFRSGGKAPAGEE